MEYMKIMHSTTAKVVIKILQFFALNLICFNKVLNVTRTEVYRSAAYFLLSIFVSIHFVLFITYFVTWFPYFKQLPTTVLRIESFLCNAIYQQTPFSIYCFHNIHVLYLNAFFYLTQYLMIACDSPQFAETHFECNFLQ